MRLKVLEVHKQSQRAALQDFEGLLRRKTADLQRSGAIDQNHGQEVTVSDWVQWPGTSQSWGGLHRAGYKR
jgi:hypothetical protein